jgi:hypothetical protein
MTGLEMVQFWLGQWWDTGALKSREKPPRKTSRERPPRIGDRPSNIPSLEEQALERQRAARAKRSAEALSRFKNRPASRPLPSPSASTPRGSNFVPGVRLDPSQVRDIRNETRNARIAPEAAKKMLDIPQSRLPVNQRNPTRASEAAKRLPLRMPLPAPKPKRRSLIKLR